MNKLAKLRPGMAGFGDAPVISAVCHGKTAYLWVGNDATGDMRCLGTMSGTQRLRRLGRAIIRATYPKKARKR